MIFDKRGTTRPSLPLMQNESSERNDKMIIPPPLRPGDTVAVVAPAGPFPPTLVWVGLGFLAQRYKVRFDRGLFSRTGFLAGDDNRRRDELCRAIEQPDVRAIFAARGGYGCNRFVHRMDWGVLARHPKWMIGFSDITALHVEAARVGVASLHGCHLTSLGQGNAHARTELLSVLENPAGERWFEGLTTIYPGRAEGDVFGGNLTLLHACAAAGRLKIPPGCILLIEDVTERPYRIDRLLMTLEVGGYLDKVRAVMLGDFDQCDPGPDGMTVQEVLKNRLTPLAIPIVANLPVGHANRNEPVMLGGKAIVEATADGARVMLQGGITKRCFYVL